MKIFYSEGPNNYSNYLFSYQVLAIRENEPVDDMYSKGFIPFRSISGLWYLARSARVNLSKFEKTSEIRRILNKIHDYTTESMNISDFKLEGKAMEIAKSFVSYAYGGYKLSDTTFKRMFRTSSNCNKVIVFRLDGEIVGFVAINETDKLVHYAYGYYDIEYKSDGIGIGMMTKVIVNSANSGKEYVYLGTIYGKSGKYKSQFRGFEFFDGLRWSEDVNQLAYLISNIDQNKIDKHILLNNEYLEFFGAKSLTRLMKKYSFFNDKTK